MGDVPRRHDEERSLGADAVGLGGVERFRQVPGPAERDLVERSRQVPGEGAQPPGVRCLARGIAASGRGIGDGSRSFSGPR